MKKKSTRIEYLLKKYDQGGYSKGVYETPEQQRKRKRKQRLKERLLILDNLLLEEPRLNLNRFEKEKVKYLIEKYPYFRKIYHHALDETIILAFIFYVKIDSDSHVNVEKWSICKKYKLNTHKYLIIITHLFSLTLSKKPLSIKPTTKYDHAILEKRSL